LELYGYEHLFYDGLPLGRFPAMRDIFEAVPLPGIELDYMLEALRV